MKLDSSNDDRGKKVEVYNIKFDCTDEEFIEHMELVGPINREKFVIKREGHKVNAQVVYIDQESALAAIRNLHNLSFKGRDLIIKYSSDNMQEDFKINESSQQQSQENDKKILINELKSLDKNSKYFLMLQLKDIAAKRKEDLLEYFAFRPQLAQAMLDIQSELSINSFQHQQKPQDILDSIAKKNPAKNINPQLIQQQRQQIQNRHIQNNSNQISQQSGQQYMGVNLLPPQGQQQQYQQQQQSSQNQQVNNNANYYQGMLINQNQMNQMQGGQGQVPSTYMQENKQMFPYKN